MTKQTLNQHLKEIKLMDDTALDLFAEQVSRSPGGECRGAEHSLRCHRCPTGRPPTRPRCDGDPRGDRPERGGVMKLGERYTDGKEIGTVEDMHGVLCVVFRDNGRIVKTVSGRRLGEKKLRKIEEGA